MAPIDSIARKLADPAPQFRSAPHNIEAEQALLGAILVNNEAFYRVSDFLEPRISTSRSISRSSSWPRN